VTVRAPRILMSPVPCTLSAPLMVTSVPLRRLGFAALPGVPSEARSLPASRL
jgi:hypothetical protein